MLIDDILNINTDNEYYIIPKENRNLKVFLINNQNEVTSSKYLMINCRKGEIENFEKLKIFCSNNSLSENDNEIELNMKDRRIIEINKNNKILTFVLIFDDEIINFGDFKDSKYFDEYKAHFNELKSKEKNVKKNRKIILIVIVVPIVILILFLIVINSVNKDGNKTIIEKEDDLLLEKFIFIRVKSHEIKDLKEVTLMYKNGYLKYTGSLKDYDANGEGKYYSRVYNNTIIFEGNFENVFPYGIGKMHYYEGNNETGYY